jgi:hypothetical protein
MPNETTWEIVRLGSSDRPPKLNNSFGKYGNSVLRPSYFGGLPDRSRHRRGLIQKIRRRVFTGNGIAE